MSRIYVDANALIAAVENPSSGLVDLFARLQMQGFKLLTSEFSLAEVLSKPIERQVASLVTIYERMIGGDGLVAALPVDRPVLRKSAEVRAMLGGKLPDAIHVATALMADCDVVLSSDKRLRLPPGLMRLATEDAAALETLP